MGIEIKMCKKWRKYEIFELVNFFFTMQNCDHIINIYTNKVYNLRASVFSGFGGTCARN